MRISPWLWFRSINEAEAAVVLQMFEWRLSGVSNCEIARRLRRLGIRTKTGANWDPRTVRNILKNEAYTGEQWWGQCRYEKIKGGKRKVTPKPAEEWIRLVGFSPRIIDPALFEAVQGAMDSSARRGSLWDYVFTPFFSCGECGSSVCGATQQGLYPYYRCQGTLGYEDRPRVCNLRSMRADELEPVLLKHIRAAVQDPTGIISDMRHDSGDGGADLDLRISHLKGRVTKVRLQVASLSIQEAKSLIDLEMFETLVAPMNHLLAQYEKESALLVEQKGRTEGFDKFEEQVRAAFLRYANGLDSLDSEGLQQLMRLLNIRLVAGPGRLLVTGVLDPSLFTIGRTSASQRAHSHRCPSA